jgi:D-glycero-alpha-D-manno-heptose-7-phosphate kinase
METRFRKTRARAPLRLGLAGGGTDLSPYCDQFGGAVLNVTIDRFAFASILPRNDRKVVFEADDLGLTEVLAPGVAPSACRLPIHAAAYLRMMRDFYDGAILGMTIRTTIDAPPGSGLGSSSALVVALVEALRAVLGAPLGPYDVARMAFEIERVDLGLSGGRQDQYAAAFGGINFIEFPDGDRAIVNPLRVAGAIRSELESSLVVCFSGRSRKSAEIIDRQVSSMLSSSGDTLVALHALKDGAIEMKRALLAGEIESMAELLNQSWVSKRATAKGISTNRIDDLMRLALDNGALGGKVSGAGGGGFMFFIVHPERRYRLVEALTAAGAAAGPVMLTDHGSETWQY